MARARTLTSLLSDVRYRADMVNDAHVSDTMLTLWINQGIAKLWRLLCKLYPDRYYATTTFNTAADTEAYEVPADFFQIRGLDLEIQGQRIPLSPQTFQERVGPGTGALFGYYGAPEMRYAVRYSPFHEAMAVYIDPPPTGVYTLLLHYVTVPPDLVEDGDTFDGIAGWEDYAIEYARALALERSEQDSAPAKLAMREVEADIVAMGSMVDASEQPKIADTRGRGGLWGRSRRRY